ncbi:MAG: Holliday junction resolvase RuvX, partial [Actinobacteria bacterium]|nr:Holliday junction resolvase RuvX [Actinomycetota bacterium]
MRIMAIDIGDKRIGLAISDKLGIVAKPLGIIKNDAGVKSNLRKIIEEYNIKKVVVGVPYTLKGEVGNQAKKALDFAAEVLISELSEELGIEIVYLDERFTTKLSRKLRKLNQMK